jgi:hypothetical protein
MMEKRLCIMDRVEGQVQVMTAGERTPAVPPKREHEEHEEGEGELDEAA